MKNILLLLLCFSSLSAKNLTLPIGKIEVEPVKHEGAFGSRGKQGRQGPPGPPGPQGPTGPQGPAGVSNAANFSGSFLDSTFSIADAADNTKAIEFDVQGSPMSTTTIIANSSANRTFTLPDIDGTAVVQQTGTGQVFMGAAASMFGSNSGVQYNTLTANRARIRLNQFGNNNGEPGITGFKSRGAAIGSLAAVQSGDVLFRGTAIGVAGDNMSIPLAAFINIVVPPGGVGSNYVATDYELQLTPLAGGRKQMFRITSEGICHVRETANSMAGVVTTNIDGNATVMNSQITATSRIALTIQDGGAVPTGAVYVSGRVVGTSFTIQSMTNDVGVDVYYQIWEPTTP